MNYVTTERLLSVWTRAGAAIFSLLLVTSLAACRGDREETASAPVAEADAAPAAPSEGEMPITAVGQIKGVVVDASGEGVPMASVMVEGTTLGAATDGGGHFVLTRIPEGSVVLDVRSGGRQTRHAAEVLRDSTVEARIEL